MNAEQCGSAQHIAAGGKPCRSAHSQLAGASAYPDRTMVLMHCTGFPNWFGGRPMSFLLDPGERFFSLARIALGQGDFPGVAKAMELYIQHLPDNPQAMVMLAGIKIAEGDRPAMTDLLDKAVKVGSQLEGAINTLGYALLGAGRIEEAIAIFEYNAGRFPKSANCLDSLAEGWLKRGDRDKAVVFYRKALEIDPRQSSAIDALKRLEVKK